MRCRVTGPEDAVHEGRPNSLCSPTFLESFRPLLYRRHVQAPAHVRDQLASALALDLVGPGPDDTAHADEILGTETRYIADIGLAKHLSPTRNNGLAALLAFIREHARHMQAGANLAG